MASEQINLGDTVRGEYHGVAFEGVAAAWDHSGFLYVRLSTSIALYGVERNRLCLDPVERRGVVVVARPTEAPAVAVMLRAVLGGAYLA